MAKPLLKKVRLFLVVALSLAVFDFIYQHNSHRQAFVLYHLNSTVVITKIEAIRPEVGTLQNDNPDNGQMESIFARRREVARQACMKYFGSSSTLEESSELPLMQSFFDFTFYNDKYKFLFCTIPKVASTNIKEMLLDLADDRPSDWKGPKERPHIHRLIELPNKKEISLRMNYTKIVFVRNPIDRLLSTWRDKFSRGVPKEDKSLLWFERYILEHYRNQSSAEPITLEEFMKFINSESILHKKIDDHWRPYVNHCDPCRVNYKYIGHFENLREDLLYVMKMTSSRDISQNFRQPAPGSYASEMNSTFRSIAPKKSSLLLAYSSKLSFNLLEQVAKLYIMDFDIFGYHVPANS